MCFVNKYCSIITYLKPFHVTHKYVTGPCTVKSIITSLVIQTYTNVLFQSKTFFGVYLCVYYMFLFFIQRMVKLYHNVF